MRFPCWLVLLASTSAWAQTDAIDLTHVVYHASIDVSSWAKTKTITEVELKPGTGDVGVRLQLDPYNPVRDADTWPDFIAFPPDGHLRWTIWLFVRMGGVWHGAAVLEFWTDRLWTGAPLLTNYGDWIYPNPGSPWDTMGDYVPQPGDLVGFMATAGDLRRHKDILSVQERSNVVVVPLVATATYNGSMLPGTGGGAAGGSAGGTAGGTAGGSAGGTAGGSAGGAAGGTAGGSAGGASAGGLGGGASAGSSGGSAGGAEMKDDPVLPSCGCGVTEGSALWLALAAAVMLRRRSAV